MFYEVSMSHVLSLPFILFFYFQTDFSFSLKPKPSRIIAKTEEDESPQFAVYNLKGKGVDTILFIRAMVKIFSSGERWNISSFTE